MIYLVLLAVVPAVVISYFTLNRARTQTIEQVTAQLESVAEFKRSQLMDWLGGNRYTLDIILADSVRAQRVVAVLDGDAPPEEAPALSQILAETVNSNRFFGGLFLYDTRGRILAASEPTEVRKVVRREPYFDVSLVENHIQPPFFDITRNQLVIVQTHPVTDRNNQTVGVLAGWLDVSALGSIMLERSGLGETGETYLVSLENNYFLTPSYFQNEGYVMNRAYKSEGINHALAGDEGNGIYVNYRDKTVIGIYRWMPELQVGLLAELEQDEALSLFHETSRYIVSLSLVAALIAAGVGVLIASQITSPVSRLKVLADRLSIGDLTARATINARNELGALGQAFNNMAEELQSRIRDEQDSKATLEQVVAN
jgi:HAMP domain-containing protein